MSSWLGLVWREAVRRIAASPVFADRATDPQAVVRADHRDYLSRSTVGARVGALGVVDGVHWRFDQGDNLGKRFLVQLGTVVEIQTAYRAPDGGVVRTVER